LTELNTLFHPAVLPDGYIGNLARQVRHNHPEKDDQVDAFARAVVMLATEAPAPARRMNVPLLGR
jgi:hypothetical protein